MCANCYKKDDPYMVLKTDAQRFLVKSPKGLRTLSSDYITESTPPPQGDKAWALANVTQTNFELEPPQEEGPECLLECFLSHKSGQTGSYCTSSCGFDSLPKWTAGRESPLYRGRRCANTGKYCDRSPWLVFRRCAMLIYDPLACQEET